MLKRFLAAIAVAAVALIGAVAVPTAANAATARNGVCEAGEFCLYYNSYQAGSVSDFAASISDYGATQPSCYDFKGAGAGKGLCVKNRAASVWNRTSKPVTVYYNSGYAGASQSFASGAKGNLNATLKNENAGHRIGAVPAPSAKMSYATYKATGGRLTAGFDGYRNTPGRHEGIDFARSTGSKVYNLVPGVITYVAEGHTGGSGLSTISVYNASLNRTVIYLHTDPVNGLRVGQSIAKGQHIAYESWRGVSSSSSAHTHIEMRLGKQTHAAKSVGDPVLQNPNPTSFWNARGYIVG
jgi:murein DD-endopeptidase MepM/ murein hydrolase activator NlpD